MKHPDLNTYTFRAEWIDDILLLAERAEFDLTLGKVVIDRPVLEALSDEALTVLHTGVTRKLREKLDGRTALRAVPATTDGFVPERPYYSERSGQWIWERSG